MKFLKYIQTNKIVGLSPMDGYTDEAMRLVQTKIAKPDVIYTEFVSAEGLAHSAGKLLDQLKYSDCEKPIIGQLFGKDPDSFYKSTVVLCYLGFDGVDINMGCPAKRVTQHGSGAILIENQKLAREIVLACRKAINDWNQDKILIDRLDFKEKFVKKIKLMGQNVTKDQTLSIKTRLGVDEVVTEEWMGFLAKLPIDLICLHGRTLKQGYAGKADWGEISKAEKIVKKINPKIVFWGNGDVRNRTEAKKYIKKYKIDGILIGRASVGNPWIFEKKERIMTTMEKYRAMILHSEIFSDVFPKRSLEHLRSKLLAYTKGFGNAKKIRKKLVRVAKLSDLLKLEEDFC